MNTEPQIKKYRRRVSEERVKRAARAMVELRYGKGAFNRMPEAEQSHHLWQARAALEADAKVIEAWSVRSGAQMQWQESGVSFNGISYLDEHTVDAEQFHAEWEEIA